MRPDPVAVRLSRLAESQEAVLHRRDLRAAGLSDSQVARWLREGHLYRKYPLVYTLGHRKLSMKGELIAALFYAGPGSGLSFTTAAWWAGVLDAEPKRIHVSATHNRESIPEIRVHAPRALELTEHNGLPMTTITRTVLDCASVLAFRDLRKLVAEVEFKRRATVDELTAICTRGHRGSRALRRALARHQPQLARARSPLEVEFVEFCEGHGITMPLLNEEVCGFTVDAVWPQAQLIVELDSRAAHSTPERMEEDRRRDLVLRGAGFDIWRYTRRQLRESEAPVAAEIRARVGSRHR
jgi:hypothetical protein